MNNNEEIKFEPFGKNLLVTLEEAADVTSGGIVTPERAKRPPQHGTVLAKGDAVGDHVNVGDRVIFALHSGKNFNLDGEDYLIMTEDAVYGRVPAGSEVKL